MFVLSLTGLLPDSVYYVTSGGPTGEPVQLASVKTDAHGSAAVMLQGKTDESPSTSGIAAGLRPTLANNTRPRSPASSLPATGESLQPVTSDVAPSLTLDGSGPAFTLSGVPSTSPARPSDPTNSLPIVTDAAGNPVMLVNPVSPKNP
jgi:hypothetical protein